MARLDVALSCELGALSSEIIANPIYHLSEVVP